MIQLQWETAGRLDPGLVCASMAVLDTGETEFLVSSPVALESSKTKDLVKLYGMRWGVEEGIKNLKP
ncbi:hypothetical protein [Cyclobacterium plantarum]|uniref:Transposase n=1 Tax=Cyclobacterium plantarum TaxID=2716263 RepID=A0ABX0HDU8_9BACT|nr:hypothetical protein [Cyclobacterium plantarum]NHE58351.1 hypothetical protein [Cyclobacterium plantarum]